MQSEEQRLIDGLFSRLKEAETRSASRDSSAEERIAGHVKEQPFAPYYMAQTILIQEAAIKKLNDRIQALENQVTQLQAAKPSSGGFSQACLAALSLAVPTPFLAQSNMVDHKPAPSLSMLRRRNSSIMRLSPRVAAVVL